MSKLKLLINELQAVHRGSLELDWHVVEILHPGARSLEPAWHYTRSLDARFAGENIVRVEKIRAEPRERWRAWLANDWSAEGNTEILSRRLAWLTFQLFSDTDRELKKRRPELRAAPEADFETKLAEDSDEPKHPRLMEPDDQLIISLLCQELRKARSNGEAPSTPADTMETNLPAATSQIQISSSTLGSRPHLSPFAALLPSSKLTEVLEVWRDEAAPTVKNIDRITRSVRRFTDMFGDRPMNAYQKNEVRRWLLQLQRMPKWQPRNLFDNLTPPLHGASSLSRFPPCPLMISTGQWL